MVAMTETRADTYPEPPHGMSRGEFIKALLKSAYRNPEAIRMTSRATSATGRQLTQRFTDRLDATAWVCEPYLTQRQVRVILLIMKYDLTVEETARRLRCGRSTVSRDKHDALETIIQIAYHDPDFRLPWRVYRKDDTPDHLP
jgi:DNA-directed RNA polymerase specialized sigma subunit